MMPSCIAERRRKPRKFGQRLPSVCGSAGWSFIRRRRRLSIARMMTGEGPIRHEKFDFLGYTFRPRRSKNRNGKFFINFSPAVSDKAVKAIRAEIRSWNLHLRSDKSIEDLSRMFNPIIRGWLQYYGRFYRSALYPPMRQLDRSLGPLGRAEIQEAARSFAKGDTLGRAHFATRSEVVGALADGCAAWLHGGSRMSGDVQVRF